MSFGLTGCGNNRARSRSQHQSPEKSQGAQRQSPLHRLGLGQAPPGLVLPRRKADCLGRVHHQQGARRHHAYHLGDGLCLRTLNAGGCLRWSRQQGHHLPANPGGGRGDQEADCRHAHKLHVLLPFSRLRQSGVDRFRRRNLRSLGRRVWSAVAELPRTHR